MQRLPGDLHIFWLGHIGHGAASFHIRQNHLLVRSTEDIGTLRHKVDTAEQGKLGLTLLSGHLAQFIAIALEVGELHDFIALIVVTQNREAGAKLTAELKDLRIALGGRHLEVAGIDLFLSERCLPVVLQAVVCANTLFGGTTGHIHLRLVEPDRGCGSVIGGCGRCRPKGFCGVLHHVRCLLCWFASTQSKLRRFRTGQW